MYSDDLRRTALESSDVLGNQVSGGSGRGDVLRCYAVTDKVHLRRAVIQCDGFVGQRPLAYGKDNAVGIDENFLPFA